MGFSGSRLLSQRRPNGILLNTIVGAVREPPLHRWGAVPTDGYIIFSPPRQHSSSRRRRGGHRFPRSPHRARQAGRAHRLPARKRPHRPVHARSRSASRRHLDQYLPRERLPVLRGYGRTHPRAHPADAGQLGLRQHREHGSTATRPRHPLGRSGGVHRRPRRKRDSGLRGLHRALCGYSPRNRCPRRTDRHPRASCRTPRHCRGGVGSSAAQNRPRRRRSQAARVLHVGPRTTGDGRPQQHRAGAN